MRKSNSVFGVVSNGAHTDVSNSLLGAKNYATRNGYTEVTERYNAGFNAAVVARKVNGKW